MKHFILTISFSTAWLFGAGGSHHIIFEEDLRIGPRGDDTRYLWVGPGVAATAGAQGHIFITDPKESRIIELDANGQFVRQIGGPGEGPGEFQFLAVTAILDDGSAIVFENQQATNIFNYFKPGFIYRDKIQRQDLSLMIQTPSFSPDGTKMGGVAVALDQATGSLVTKSFVARSDFTVIKSWDIDTSPSFDPAKINDRAYWVEFLANRFKIGISRSLGYMTFDDQNRVYTATAGSYEIHCWNDTMTESVTFGREYKPRPRSEQEIAAVVAPIHEAILAGLPAQLHSMVNNQVVREAVAKAELLPIHNPINGIRGTDDGRITVIHELSFSGNYAEIDFFSTDGQYLGAYRHPNVGAFNMTFKDGYAYVIETNADDDQELARYKVRFQPGS